MRHVVRAYFLFLFTFGVSELVNLTDSLLRHASIDPATRAARGLPEDLIRLCVGIEDPEDLVEDLERALLEAGAISLVPSAEGEDVYTRINRSQAKSLEGLTSSIKGLGLEGHKKTESAQEYLVSAPGKVILFGEHAVVHGVVCSLLSSSFYSKLTSLSRQTAIAASVDLRCYGHVATRSDRKLALHLPDLDNFTHEWDIEADLPWSSATPNFISPGSPHPDTLSSSLIDAITLHAIPSSAASDKRITPSIVAFLYLYMSLSLSSQNNDERPAFTFTARSNLPIGAGLGSSASYSVCLSTSFLLLFNNRISIPSEPLPSSSPSSSNPVGHTHVGHNGRKALPKELADEVNRWAFVAEKVLHGNPSGVDNSVATYGGALGFTRGGFEGAGRRKGGLESIQGCVSFFTAEEQSELLTADSVQ